MSDSYRGVDKKLKKKLKEQYIKSRQNRQKRRIADDKEQSRSSDKKTDNDCDNWN
jgi:hypothetical protein